MMNTTDRKDGPAPEVSVVIPVYNGERYLAEVLEAVFSQETGFSFEVIIIDSGSSDRSLDVAGGFPVRLHRIPNEEFGHGRTRNLGARLAAGRYVVFISQDATPAHRRWLENLVGSVAKDAGVAGAYSRHLPRPDCNPIERREILSGTPPVSSLRKVDFDDEFQRKNYEQHWAQYMVFSDVSSCIRKEVIERLPFNEDIVMSEDHEWCKRAVEAGYAVAYTAESAVYHSHNHPIRTAYRRFFDYGRSFREFAGLRVSFKNVVFYTAHESIMDIMFIMKQPGGALWKLGFALKAPATRFAMRYGFYRGLNNGGGRTGTGPGRP